MHPDINAASPTYPPSRTPPTRSSVRGTLVAASLAVMVAQIANALPGALNGVFQETFGTVGSQLTWITAAFMIPVVVFELTFGVLGDKYGHRSLVVGGAGVVMIGSLVCAVSPTVEWMWVGSAINGLGAGAVFPASLALVASVAETSRERIRGIAMWAGFLSAGSAASPLLGGILAGFGWWRAAYVVVAASGLTALAVALWKSRDSERQQGRRPDCGDRSPSHSA